MKQESKRRLNISFTTGGGDGTPQKKKPTKSIPMCDISHVHHLMFMNFTNPMKMAEEGCLEVDPDDPSKFLARVLLDPCNPTACYWASETRAIKAVVVVASQEVTDSEKPSSASENSRGSGSYRFTLYVIDDGDCRSKVTSVMLAGCRCRDIAAESKLYFSNLKQLCLLAWLASGPQCLGHTVKAIHVNSLAGLSYIDQRQSPLEPFVCDLAECSIQSSVNHGWPCF